jgi:hypothetical protein
MSKTTASVKREQELMRLEVELRNFERSTLNTIARMHRRMERIKQYGKEEKREQAGG